MVFWLARGFIRQRSQQPCQPPIRRDRKNLDTASSRFQKGSILVGHFAIQIAFQRAGRLTITLKCMAFYFNGRLAH
ncbi:hypothetical protein PGTUg99_028565 [Puccinia graminis f. sp. tritici]|uniref:Uncharacterized protein n=1 Tax=Puccinia graminis f. sp. tritici TaxID=56615 RepID=A0A5B0MFW5_PUCGR|nr:hypothetical protein PGTUg99_028565 [Puccinia graminis f. sp. tritici]